MFVEVQITWVSFRFALYAPGLGANSSSLTASPRLSPLTASNAVPSGPGSHTSASSVRAGPVSLLPMQHTALHREGLAK